MNIFYIYNNKYKASGTSWNKKLHRANIKQEDATIRNISAEVTQNTAKWVKASTK